MKRTTVTSTGHILTVEINDLLPSGIHSTKSKSRVIPNILHLLDHIDKHRAEANFYITSPLMRDFPEIVSLVYSKGHEIGLCLDFRRSVCLSGIADFKNELEQIINHQSYGVMLKSDLKNQHLCLKSLAAAGFSYCLTDFDPAPRWSSSQPVDVFSPSQYTFFRVMINFGQPGKIRMYPYWFLRRCMEKFTNKNCPAVLNFPLWEFDPYLHRHIFTPVRVFKSYGEMSPAEFKLIRLLTEFDFVKAVRILGLDEC
jgi:hypothetical protein